VIFVQIVGQIGIFSKIGKIGKNSSKLGFFKDICSILFINEWKLCFALKFSF